MPTGLDGQQGEAAMADENASLGDASFVHVFIDDAMIEESAGVVRRMMPPLHMPDPVLVPEHSWEVDRWIGDSGVSVVQEPGGTCHMWYMLTFGGRDEQQVRGRIDAVGLDEKTRADLLSCPRYIMCYAVSDDGITWHKPSLHRIQVDGNAANNIVYAGRLGQSVFLDPTAPAESRFKMIHGGGERMPHRLSGEQAPARNVYHGIYGATSPDGIAWTPTPQPIMPWYTDTTNVAYWDDQRAAYVAFVRWNEGMVFENGMTVMKHPVFYRAIGRAESRDFFDFPRPSRVLRPPRRLWYPYNTGTDYYNTAAMKYPYAPDAYFLFISFFHHDTGMVDVRLAGSRDGVSYRIWPEPFTRLGQDGRFDSRCMYMATGVVDRGDCFDLYYRGYSYPHHAPLVPRSSYTTEGAPVGIGRLQVRKDGFIAQCFAKRGGSLLTRPFELKGDRILLNVDAGAGGWVRAEMRTHDGQVVAEFGEADAVPVRGNGVAVPLAWEGGADVGDLRGRTVRLHLRGADARLYALRTI